MPDSWTEVFRSADSAQASDKSFMLTAVGIAALMTVVEDGYSVLVETEHVGRARAELASYAHESRPRPRPSAPPPLAPGAVRASAIAVGILFAIAGASTRHGLHRDWYEAGVLDGEMLRNGAWWRALTALTLHADAAHLLGNAGFGAVFGAATAALYGPGFGWLLILVAAFAANLIEGAWLPAGVRSLGASTAVFAALGLVTARGRGAGHGEGLVRGLYGALVAGVLLLALLGTGDAHTDVLGHALGFVFGLAAGLPFRERRTLFPRHEGLFGLLACGLLALGWTLALYRGS